MNYKLAKLREKQPKTRIPSLNKMPNPIMQSVPPFSSSWPGSGAITIEASPDLDELAERMGLVATEEVSGSVLDPPSGIFLHTENGYYSLIEIIEVLMGDATAST